MTAPTPVSGATAGSIAAAVATLAERFAANRHDRQRRRHLDPEDFAALAGTGFPLATVPVQAGGLWEKPAKSVRFIASLLRTLATGDSSVALVSVTHPSVLGFW